MDKKVSKTVSMLESWWDTIDTFETDRSKYLQGLVAEDFESRGITHESADSTSIREASAGALAVGVPPTEIAEAILELTRRRASAAAAGAN